MNAPSAIRLKGLEHRYRDDLPLVLSGMDLEIFGGESFGLVGPDGAGKTTLIRLLCGLLNQTSGQIEVFGERLPEGIERLKPRIGYVSQRFSLYGDLTIKENLDFFGDIHGVRGQEAARRKQELLEFTRLAPFQHRLADRLSGGMRQKLSLICTLIHQPELLMLDEPTTGVDPITRRDFWAILSSLLEQGLTIVMSTPYLDEAERCSRVALLDQGRIMDAGTPLDLKQRSALKVLEIVCSPIREAAELLEQERQVRAVHSFGDRLHLLLEKTALLDQLIQRSRSLLEASGVQVFDSREVTASLEDVFIQLVEENKNEAVAGVE